MKQKQSLNCVVGERGGDVILETKDDYAQVIETFGTLVYRLCFVYLKNKPDADDAYQDVFIKLMEKKPVFNDGAHLKAWLITVTTNHCKNVLRFQRFHRSVALHEEMPAKKNEEDQIITLVMNLPLKYRNVLFLYYYEGYKTKEIAVLLKTNEATIRTRLKRGKEALRIAIAKEEIYA